MMTKRDAPKENRVRMEYKNPVLDPIIEGVLTLSSLRTKTSVAADVERGPGINYMIILGACTYFEAMLELGPFEIFTRLPKAAHSIDVSLREKMIQELQEAHGSKAYRDIFELITGEKLPTLRFLKSEWEGIMILFSLRNVLAHGRPLRLLIDIPSNITGTPDYQYADCFQKIHDYLKKRGIVSGPIDPLSLDWFFLSDSVADHFWELAFRTVAMIGESLSGEQAEAFKFAVYKPEHCVLAQRMTVQSDTVEIKEE